MALREPVAALMREVGAGIVMPRFRRLASDEIAEKSPGEIVTAADFEAEARLFEGLSRLLPEARIVGEEAAQHDPSMLDGIDRGLVWLIDPLDGTANFAAGRAPFGVMVALVEDGIPLAGWLLDPLSGRLCHAERGKGATCDGARIVAQPMQRDVPVAALGTHFMGEERRALVHARAERDFRVVPVPRCAAESYPRVVLGDDDIALFQRILPWDHAAGVLFLCEAGGCVTHWNGQPWRVGGPGRGVLAAASEALWQMAAQALLQPGAGLIEMDAMTS